MEFNESINRVQFFVVLLWATFVSLFDPHLSLKLIKDVSKKYS